MGMIIITELSSVFYFAAKNSFVKDIVLPFSVLEINMVKKENRNHNNKTVQNRVPSSLFIFSKAYKAYTSFCFNRQILIKELSLPGVTEPSG